MKPFFDRYTGQTIGQLVGLRDQYRTDSLVLAVEAALLRKPAGERSAVETAILAVEAMEREVNNGGFDQFFLNCGGLATPLADALERIGCPKLAAIALDATRVLALPANADEGMISGIAAELSDESLKALGDCDSRYYRNDEDIAGNMFDFIVRNQEEIRIP